MLFNCVSLCGFANGFELSLTMERVLLSTMPLSLAILTELALVEVISTSSFWANDCSKGFGSRSRVFLFENVETMSGLDREFELDMLTMLVATVEDGKDMAIQNTLT